LILTAAAVSPLTKNARCRQIVIRRKRHCYAMITIRRFIDAFILWLHTSLLHRISSAPCQVAKHEAIEIINIE
jgi:hypothetical protein